MPNAARKTDTTAHGLPLSPGPGSPDIDIGFLPAWRALPSGVGASVEAASNAMDSLIGTSTLTPANAAKPLADIAKALAESAANAAVEGNPSAIGPTVTALITLNTTNVALTTAWTSASAAPGGQPAANTAYTQGIKAAAAGAATAVFSSVGAMADMHNCSVVVPPMPHGPGLVTKGSKSVIFNNLPAARQNDQVMEACGGADPIQMGCTTVEIGDLEGSGGAGGGEGGTGESGGASGQALERTALQSAVAQYSDEAPGSTSIKSISLGVVCECSQSGCAEAFRNASRDGTPLVERDAPGCGGPANEVVEAGVHWIEFELLGEDDRGVPYEPYLARLPSGREIRGSLDADGRARLEGLQFAGACRISFPNLDADAWEELP